MKRAHRYGFVAVLWACLLSPAQADPPGVSSPLTALPPLTVIPRIYVDEKDVPGLANADRKLEIRVVLDNPGGAPKTLVLCPMLHVHNPSDPAQTGQVLAITATGGQRVDGVYTHGRTFRFPFPLPTPFTINANSQVPITYSVKLSEFIPTLENFTRAEIMAMIQAHAAAVSSTMYIDYFFNFNLEPGDVFQCPHGPNTWWKFGIDDPDDFDESYHWFDFTFFIDTTPPAIVPTVTPPPNAAGWNNTDVTVSWSVSDPESGIASSSGCDTTIHTAETSGTTLTCSATNRAGLSNSVSVTVKIDKTPPTILAIHTPPANAAGWNNTDVTKSYTCADALSGVANCPPPEIITAEGIHTVMGTAVDLAGNTATHTQQVKIDKTPPTVACSVSPSTLRPPNHKLVSVTTAVTVTGNLSGPAGFSLTAATSNEPDEGLGDGDFPNDIQGFVIGTPDTSGLLRAERSGRGTGRVYALSYEGMDAAGNSATCSATVRVPHDLR